MPETSASVSNLDSLSADILRGADEIAEFYYGRREDRWKIYRAHKLKRLPLFRDGAVLCARKSTLREHVRQREALAVVEL
jgi:hypothetical protein